MHDDMQYDPIQGQGHEPFRVGNLVVQLSQYLCDYVLNGRDGVRSFCG